MPGKKRVHRAIEQVAIAGEIRDHAELIAKRDDADNVGRSHLLAQELLRSERGTRQIVWLQRSEVEEKNDHAAIAHLLPNFFRRSNGTDGDGNGNGLRGIGLFDFFHVVVIERGNLLDLPSSAMLN